MKVLLFEWLTGGGLWADPAGLETAGQLLNQGVTMVSAVGKDLTKFAEVDLLVDSRLTCTEALDDGSVAPAGTELHEVMSLVEVHRVDSQTSLKTKLASLAREADAILLIAPETDSCLVNSIQWLGHEKYKLISPSLDFVEATSNKNWLAGRLSQTGFDELPEGMDLASFLILNAEQQAAWLPMIVKPADGAGSEGVEYLKTEADLDDWLTTNADAPSTDFRVEEFVPGTRASISIVCRKDHQPIFFPALKQVLLPPPVGEYQRSEDCLTNSQKLRAEKLASKAIACLPQTTGFFGLDIVLGDDQRFQTPRDVLIEINPRITMSYLWLSQTLGEGKIAELMLGGLVD